MVELFPTRFERIDNANRKVTGDLTIKDITKPVTLDVEYASMQPTPWGSSRRFSVQPVSSTVRHGA